MQTAKRAIWIVATILAVSTISQANAHTRKHHHHYQASTSIAVPNCDNNGRCIESVVTAPVRVAVHVAHRAVRTAAHIVSYGSDLVSRAAAYMGGNPTGWRHNWCGKFMSMIAPDAAARIRNPNQARDWAELPHTSAHVGAIAVMPHHVGVVSGFDANGNPVIVSGNHNHRVGEGVYPRSRIIAYVEP